MLLKEDYESPDGDGNSDGARLGLGYGNGTIYDPGYGYGNGFGDGNSYSYGHGDGHGNGYYKRLTIILEWQAYFGSYDERDRALALLDLGNNCG